MSNYSAILPAYSDISATARLAGKNDMLISCTFFLYFSWSFLCVVLSYYSRHFVIFYFFLSSFFPFTVLILPSLFSFFLLSLLICLYQYLVCQSWSSSVCPGLSWGVFTLSFSRLPGDPHEDATVEISWHQMSNTGNNRHSICGSCHWSVSVD